MRIKHIIILAILGVVAFSAQAQKNLPKTAVDGAEFYYYVPSAGESIYDIAAKLGVTKDEIIKYNPDVADGIENGMRLYFPVEDGQTLSQTTGVQTHKVEQGETLYGLAKRYGITVEELIAANPGTDNGIKTGQVLNIPQGSTTYPPAVDADQQVKNAFSQNNASVMNVMLPEGSEPMYITMQLIRHKTQHKKFMIGLPLLILLHIALVVLYFWLRHKLAA